MNQAIKRYLQNPTSLSAILIFCEEVCKRAEDKMLKTRKLEGAHFAAMKELLSELENETETGKAREK